MSRTKRSDIEEVFEYFLQSIGGRKATSFGDVGGYRLDYNSIYGGYVIERIVTDGGGVTRPFGDQRMTASAFCDCLWFARRAVSMAEETPATE